MGVNPIESSGYPSISGITLKLGPAPVKGASQGPRGENSVQALFLMIVPGVGLHLREEGGAFLDLHQVLIYG